jgi:hypothetical protein
LQKNAIKECWRGNETAQQEEEAKHGYQRAPESGWILGKMPAPRRLPQFISTVDIHSRP